MTQLPRLLQLCSQALPVGAYAYSQGLEAAINDGVITNATTAECWIRGVFRYGVAELDLVALALAVQMMQVDADSSEKVGDIDQYLQASRETAELLLEDVEMGRALRRLLDTLGLPATPVTGRPSFVTQFARAGVSWEISKNELMSGFCFSWLENQIAAATKSIPLGQSESQLMLGELIELIGPAVTRANELANTQLTADGQIRDSLHWRFGRSMPGLSMYSSFHETQEARLYRS